MEVNMVDHERLPICCYEYIKEGTGTADRMNACRGGQPIHDVVMDTSFSGLKDEAMGPPLRDHKMCIVMDSNVAGLYLEEVTITLSGYCKEVFVYVFFAGKESKNPDTIKRLYEHLILGHFDCRGILAALGGGVIGDLCSFAATTHPRGVGLLQIPTVLLSQVDSSIGGKTGVDFNTYEDIVEAFHTSRFVYTNPSTLPTLSNEQFSLGMGEVIRHDLTKDKEYYRWLKDSQEGTGVRGLTLCQKMVFENSRIRKQVVEVGPTEQGERALLNFGHTPGYAVERLKDFTTLHNHRTGLECIVAGYTSYKRGMIVGEKFKDLGSVFDAYGLPVTADGPTRNEAHTAAKGNKKVDAGAARLVLLRPMGSVYADRTVSNDEMKEGFDRIGGHKE